MRSEKIRKVLYSNVPRQCWVNLKEIYKIVEENAQLGGDDFRPEKHTKNVPQWKRTVRSVLLSEKDRGHIYYDRKGNY